MPTPLLLGRTHKTADLTTREQTVWRQKEGERAELPHDEKRTQLSLQSPTLPKVRNRFFSANSSSTSGKKTAFSELFGPRFVKRAKPDGSAIEC